MIKRLKQVVKSIANSVNIWIEKRIVQAANLAPMETSSWRNQYCDYILQIEVKRCSDNRFWYHREIGTIFMVEAQDSDHYWVREPDEHRCLNFVLKKDAVVI
jgi:hypothetical protein